MTDPDPKLPRFPLDHFRFCPSNQKLSVAQPGCHRERRIAPTFSLDSQALCRPQRVVVRLGHATSIDSGLLAHFLENDRVAVRVFNTEELEPVGCHFRTLSLQAPRCEFLICKLYV
jgi:hypothetical protein